MKNLDQYKSLQEQIAKLQEQTKEAAKILIRDGLKNIFDKYPSIENISWTQYTPYFNDGDPCVFRVGAYDPNINGEDTWGLKEDLDERKASNDAGHILRYISDADY